MAYLRLVFKSMEIESWKNIYTLSCFPQLLNDMICLLNSFFSVYEKFSDEVSLSCPTLWNQFITLNVVHRNQVSDWD